MDRFGVDWRGLAPQAAAETLARQETARLAEWYPDLAVCRVAVEAAGLRPASGEACVSIEVRGPQRQVIVNRAHADAGIALRQAFDAIFRKFERRGRTDRRATPRPERKLRAA